MAVQQQTQRELLGNPRAHRRFDWLGDSSVEAPAAEYVAEALLKPVQDICACVQGYRSAKRLFDPCE